MRIKTHAAASSQAAAQPGRRCWWRWVVVLPLAAQALVWLVPAGRDLLVQRGVVPHVRLRLGQYGERAVASCVAWSPDGRIIASGTRTYAPQRLRDGRSPFIGRLQLWDARRGTLLRTLPDAHPRGLFALAFSPDGRWLASSGSDTGVRLWDVGSGRLARTLPEGVTRGAWSLAFSPDGRTLATSGSSVMSTAKGVQLWDTATGRLRRTLIPQSAPTRRLRSNRGTVHSVAFSPDGRIVAATVDAEDTDLEAEVASDITCGLAILWDADTGMVRRTFPLMTGVSDVAFSPDGSMLVVGGTPYGWTSAWGKYANSLVSTFDVRTGKTLWEWRGRGDRDWYVDSVAFSPDGHLLVTGDSGQAFVRDARTGKLLRTLRAGDRYPDGGNPISTTSLAFSPDGHMLALRGAQRTTLWNVEKLHADLF